MMKKLLIAIALILSLAALLSGLSVGLNRAERAECIEWQRQSADYARLFYLTKWQAEQCEAHGVVIKAPVK